MRRTRIAAVVSLAAALMTAALVEGAGAVVAGNGAFHAKLRGSSEVGPAGQRAVGDPDGYGSFTAIPVGPNKLCYGLTVNDVATPLAAHIHRGGAGVNGPVVIPLRKPAGSPGASSGCVTIAPDLYLRLRANPGNWYVNVHTGPFRDGAIRGQLSGS